MVVLHLIVVNCNIESASLRHASEPDFVKFISVGTSSKFLLNRGLTPFQPVQVRVTPAAAFFFLMLLTRRGVSVCKPVPRPGHCTVRGIPDPLHRRPIDNQRKNRAALKQEAKIAHGKPCRLFFLPNRAHHLPGSQCYLPSKFCHDGWHLDKQVK